MNGRWVRVESGRHRCQQCCEFVVVAWLFYRGTQWSHCLCETCVETLLKEDG